MKVFLSWSGDRSRGIAEALKGWLPSVLQAVKPYFSPDDVSKGSRWTAEIANELEASRVALLILTPENQEAPWLLFEAGALSKNLGSSNLGSSKVCPLLFGGMQPTDVKGPLVQFQAAQFSAEEMKRVLTMINSQLGELALASAVLDGVFEMWWPKLEKEVSQQVNAGVTGKAPHRDERELLEEVLALARSIDSKTGPRIGQGVSVSRRGLRTLVQSAVKLARTALKCAPTYDTVEFVRLLCISVDFVLRSGKIRGFDSILEEVAILKSNVSDTGSGLEMIVNPARGTEPANEGPDPGVDVAF